MGTLFTTPDKDAGKPRTDTMTLPHETIVQTKSLFISAGHSHTDPGAVGNGHTEADIVLAFRDAVCDELDAKGIHYGSDGRRGVNMPLRQAIEMASHHDVAVEFHCNAFKCSNKISLTGIFIKTIKENFK